MSEPSGTDAIAERLSAIAQEMCDLAYERLREATSAIGERGEPDPALLQEEKRLNRARRSVEKAAAVLRTPTQTAEPTS